MLRNIFGIVVIAATISGCNRTEPVGGRGYFDAPLSNYQPTVIAPPASTPLPPEPGDMTEGLATAVETALANTQTPLETATVTPTVTPTPEPIETSDTINTDDGRLDLNVTSLDQQIIERNEAARILAEARAKLVIIEPGVLPEVVAGVNIAYYARQTSNQVGERLYRRPVIKARFSNTECRKFAVPDDAQRYFLANDGPQKDPLNLDPDGDGFACKWSPAAFRALQ
ncbi:MAG: hypothetical protein V3V13_05665 [Paracoccaceae bacterium]